MKFSYRWCVVGTLLTIIGAGVNMEKVTIAVYVASIIIGIGCGVDARYDSSG